MVGGGAVGILSLCAFACAQRSRSVYIAPRCTARPRDTIYAPHPKIKSQDRGGALLGWVWWSLRLSYDEMLHGVRGTGTRENGRSGDLLKVNMDAIVLLRFHAVGLRVSALATVLAICIILPLNWTAQCAAVKLTESTLSQQNFFFCTDDNVFDPEKVSTFDRTTLSHIPPLSKSIFWDYNDYYDDLPLLLRFYAIVVCSWILTIYSCKTLFKEWVEILALRRVYYLEADHFVNRNRELDCIRKVGKHGETNTSRMSARENVARRDIWIPHPEQRDTVPNIELYSVLVGGLPNLPSEVVEAKDIEAAANFSKMQAIDWQLAVATSFFDHCVPNQPGFSSSVAAISILPDAPELARAWRKWYVAAAALRRLHFIRSLIADLRFYDIEVCDSEDEDIEGGIQGIGVNYSQRHSDIGGGEKARRRVRKSNKGLPKLEVQRQRTSNYHRVFGGDDQEEVESILMQAMNYGPEQTAVYSRELAHGAASCCPHGCNEEKLRKASIDELIKLEKEALAAVEAADLSLRYARELAAVSVLEGPEETRSKKDASNKSVPTKKMIKSKGGAGETSRVGHRRGKSFDDIKALPRELGTDLEMELQLLKQSGSKASLSGRKTPKTINSKDFRRHGVMSSPDLRERPIVDILEPPPVVANGGNALGLSMYPNPYLSVLTEEFSEGTAASDTAAAAATAASVAAASAAAPPASALPPPPARFQSAPEFMEAELSPDASLRSVCLVETNGVSQKQQNSLQLNSVHLNSCSSMSGSFDAQSFARRSLKRGSRKTPTNFNNPVNFSLNSEGKFFVRHDHPSFCEPIDETSTYTPVKISNGRGPNTTRRRPLTNSIGTDISKFKSNDKRSEQWKQVKHITAMSEGDKRKGDQGWPFDGVWNKPSVSGIIKYVLHYLLSITWWPLRKTGRAVNSVSRLSSYAVVTFTSRQAAVAARHCLADGRGANRWRPLNSLPVPPLADAAPCDLKTCRGCCRPVTLSINTKQQTIRKYVCMMLLTLIYTLYVVPIAIASAFIDVKKIYEIYPSVKIFFSDYPYFDKLYSGMVTALLLTLFFALCPIMFKCIANSGSNSTSVNLAERAAMRYYWAFMVVTAFTGSTVMNTISSAINEHKLHDLKEYTYSRVIKEIGNTIPVKISAIWINWIILRSTVILPMQYLLQVNTFMFMALKWNCLARAVMGGGPGGTLPYRVYIDSGVVYMCTVSLAVASPLVAPCSFFYFLVCQPLWRRNSIFTYRPKFDGGGMRWPFLFDVFISSLIVGQILLIVMIGLKGAYGAAFMAGIPIVPTLIYRKSCLSRFFEPFMDCGLLQTSLLDGWDDEGDSSSVTKREEFRRFLVDCHKAAYIPVCIAGEQTNVLTAEPAIVTSLDFDEQDEDITTLLPAEWLPHRQASINSNNNGLPGTVKTENSSEDNEVLDPSCVQS